MKEKIEEDISNFNGSIEKKKAEIESIKTQIEGFNAEIIETRETIENSSKTKEDFETGLINLYNNEVIPAIKKHRLCATVLTQVSDVEDETNGLLTYDRQVLKVNPTEMQKMAKAVFDAFYNS